MALWDDLPERRLKAEDIERLLERPTVKAVMVKLRHLGENGQNGLVVASERNLHYLSFNGEWRRFDTEPIQSADARQTYDWNGWETVENEYDLAALLDGDDEADAAEEDDVADAIQMAAAGGGGGGSTLASYQIEQPEGRALWVGGGAGGTAPITSGEVEALEDPEVLGHLMDHDKTNSRATVKTESGDLVEVAVGTDPGEVRLEQRSGYMVALVNRGEKE